MENKELNRIPLFFVFFCNLFKGTSSVWGLLQLGSYQDFLKFISLYYFCCLSTHRHLLTNHRSAPVLAVALLSSAPSRAAPQGLPPAAHPSPSPVSQGRAGKLCALSAGRQQPSPRASLHRLGSPRAGGHRSGEAKRIPSSPRPYTICARCLGSLLPG